MKTYLITYRFKGHCGRCGAERFIEKKQTVIAEHPHLALNKAEGQLYDPESQGSVDPIDEGIPIRITIEERS